MGHEHGHLHLPARCVALILAGGRGSRLKNLTDRRAKPAVHFGGKYRIIDFVLSNCINSEIRRIYVMTQYKSHSLLRHIQHGWNVLRSEVDEFIDLVPAQQRVDANMWYRGTADAVWQNLDILKAENPDFVLVLAGDHIYRMDYEIMLRQHVNSGAELTVGCIEVPREEASEFGVMATDDEGRIVEFFEKPAEPPSMPGKPDSSLASMGIYIFNAQFLFDELTADAEDQTSTHDFGRDFIPRLIGDHRVMAHSLRESAIYTEGRDEPYWRDVGTLDAYWQSNMDLCSVTPLLDLYDKEWPVFSYVQQLPPAKFVHDTDGRRGSAVDSVVANGTIISGGTVRRSVISTEVRVNSFAEVNDSVILPAVNIGRHARINSCIIDRGCEIPEGFVIGEDPELDAERFLRTEGGITLVTSDMLEALNG